MTPLIPKTRFFPESARREPPPPRRCSDGSLLSEDEEGNSNRLMVGDKNSRTRPYYLRRCKRVRPTNIESLPSELLSDILVRLSADHLYDRVRLACLRWYHIIHSYDFVNAQIQHSTCGLLLCCSEVWGGHHPILITATQGGRIETSEFTYLYRGKLINCCNGLCLETYCRHRIPYIINPATKQSFIIPSLPHTASLRVDRFGIAFAPRSMKYKLTSSFWKFNKIHLGILTFGVDNSWRHVAIDSVHGCNVEFLLSKHPLVTEGFIHWMCEYRRIVLTLDIETEILTKSIIPFSTSYLCTKRRYYLSTGTFLSMLAGNERDFSWDVWGMKSETGEWRKVLPDIKMESQKCRLQQLASTGQILEPIGWVKYPEVLALRFRGESRTCIFYNLDTHEINSTELPYPCSWYIGFVYKNSLVWLS